MSIFGAIADDFTGATDLANTLTRGGMRTIQTVGIPDDRLDTSGADAIVVALKTRSIPAADAIDASLAALRRLQARGVGQVMFKYCSTFDSTDRGNIGPVAAALADALEQRFTIFCPAFPEAGRRIFNGYLFVGDVLLSESGMRDHPVTPMRDANLVRVLQRQSDRPVGLVGLSAIRAGAAAVRAEFARAQARGVAFAVADATEDDDLRVLAQAFGDSALVTGGSGIALGIPDELRRRGLLARAPENEPWPELGPHSAVVAGSCSTATIEQVARFEAAHPTRRLGAADFSDPDRTVAETLAWARPHLQRETIAIASSATPEGVAVVRSALGNDAGALVEATLARIARGLVDAGVRRLIVAGGETSGAVVSALDLRALRIGAQIDPGVPWTLSVAADPIALALKSGNFGAADFFERAFTLIP